MTTTLRIGDRSVGPGHRPYVIAELSANHGGSAARARELVHAAAEAGVDAVKLQTYTASSMVIDADLPELVVSDGGLWDGRRLADLYDEGSTPWEWHAELVELATGLGVHAFSSAFDPPAAVRLGRLGVPAVKIGSAELVYDELLAAAGATGAPVLVSTGMATDPEIDHAIEVLAAHACGGFGLLHCVAEYPTPPHRAALGRIAELRARHGTVVGWSDHTLGIGVAVAAVALGADLVEKHVCLRRSDGDLDAAFSLEPHELRELVAAAHDAHLAAAAPSVDPVDPDDPAQRRTGDFPHRRSLRATRDLRPGDVIDTGSVGVFRPGGGMNPTTLPSLIGRRLVRPLARGGALTDAHLEEPDPCA